MRLRLPRLKACFLTRLSTTHRGHTAAPSFGQMHDGVCIDHLIHKIVSKIKRIETQKAIIPPRATRPTASRHAAMASYPCEPPVIRRGMMHMASSSWKRSLHAYGTRTCEMRVWLLQTAQEKSLLRSLATATIPHRSQTYRSHCREHSSSSGGQVRRGRIRKAAHAHGTQRTTLVCAKHASGREERDSAR